MKKLICLLLAAAASLSLSFAADHQKNEQACSKADNIIGKYYIEYKGECSKVRFYKCTDGSYQCKIYWVPKTRDENGNVILDKKNPDKSKRNVPADQILLIWNLKYDAAEKEWSGGTIYDPKGGITARCTATLVDDGKTVKIFGNVLGIGKSVYWTKIDE